MSRVVEVVWRWRWLVAVLGVLALATLYYARWRSEEGRLDGLRLQGEEAFRAREYGTAREYLTSYLDARPQDVRARLLLARSARKLRQYDAAADELQKCRDQGGDPESIAVESTLIAVERGDTRPIPDLRARVAEKNDEVSLAVLEVLIQHDLDMYRLRDALQGFNVYLERRPDDLYALVGRGVLWERLLSFADAVVDYRRAVAAHPTSDRARRRLAAALLIVGTPAEALEEYRNLAKSFPTDATIKLGLAKCHRQLNRPEEARVLLDEIIVTSLDHLNSTPAYAEVLWERGQLEMDLGRPTKAEPWLVRADKAAPFDRRTAFSLFNCLLALDRKEDAAAVNRRIEQIDADVRQLETIRQRVMTNPNDAALRIEGGKIFLRNGEREEGIRWLELALRFDPTRDDARAALAAARASP
jgi:tetratricopeptide (TPR) repeat protein